MKAFIIIPVAFFFHAFFAAKERIGNIPEEISRKSMISASDNSRERILPPLGCSAINKINKIDPLLKELEKNNIQSAIESLHFDSSLTISNKIFGDRSILRLEDYYNAPINQKNFGLYDIKISTKYLYINKVYLYFISVKDKSQYSKMSRLYLASVIKGQIADVKMIYNETQREMGFADYTLFYIDRSYTIACRDYKVTEDPLKAGSIKRYRINNKGKFAALSLK